jgi:hypothetical protein
MKPFFLFVYLFLICTALSANVEHTDINITKIGQIFSVTERAYIGDQYSRTVTIDPMLIDKHSKPVDVVIVIDNTASMGDAIDNVKNNISDLLRDVKKSFPDVRMAVATIADHDSYTDGKDTLINDAFEVQTPFTTDEKKLSQKVESMKIVGMANGKLYDDVIEEAYLYGLHQSANMDWRNDATKILIFIGDSNPHEVDAGGDKKRGTQDDLKYQQVIDEIKNHDIHIYSIFLDNNHDRAKNYKLGEQFFSDIARESNGEMFEMSRDNAIVSRIETTLSNFTTPHFQVTHGYETWMNKNQLPSFTITVPKNAESSTHHIKVDVKSSSVILATLDFTLIMTKPWGLLIIFAILLSTLPLAAIVLVHNKIHTGIMLGNDAVKQFLWMMLSVLIYIVMLYKLWMIMNMRFFPVIWEGFWW